MNRYGEMQWDCVFPYCMFIKTTGKEKTDDINDCRSSMQGLVG